MAEGQPSELPDEHVVGTVETAKGKVVTILTDTGERIHTVFPSGYAEASTLFAAGMRWNFGLKRINGSPQIFTIADVPPHTAGGDDQKET